MDFDALKEAQSGLGTAAVIVMDKSTVSRGPWCFLLAFVERGARRCALALARRPPRATWG
jgi:NADH:ubiquinone oxidoreductase subunit F (NADH-binding)